MVNIALVTLLMCSNYLMTTLYNLNFKKRLLLKQYCWDWKATVWLNLNGTLCAPMFGIQFQYFKVGVECIDNNSLNNFALVWKEIYFVFDFMLSKFVPVYLPYRQLYYLKSQ